jgi:hypothetical protein
LSCIAHHEVINVAVRVDAFINVLVAGEHHSHTELLEKRLKPGPQIAIRPMIPGMRVERW